MHNTGRGHGQALAQYHYLTDVLMMLAAHASEVQYAICHLPSVSVICLCHSHP